MKPTQTAAFIRGIIFQEVANQDLITAYRDPLIGFVPADDPRFSNLSTLTGFKHYLPSDLLPGARSVICFFLPFSPAIAYANQDHKDVVAREWAVAYMETNALIGRITRRLISELADRGIRAAAEPATGNFNEADLKSHWSHKSIAVLAGIGSFGLHQLVITDAGCAGRFGSLVLDIELPVTNPAQKERCDYFASGSCLDCVIACPVDALGEDKQFDRRACWEQCLKNGEYFQALGDDVHVCGKCAVLGPCALKSAV